MAPTIATDLPCDGDGVCMICKTKPSESESLVCTLCVTPWHVPCLSAPPETMASAVNWKCPDCSGPTNVAPYASSSGLIASVRAIEADGSLTELEKARRRQELLGGSVKIGEGEEEEGVEDEREVDKTKMENDNVLELLDLSFNCSFCMQLPQRPVTTPCGHNFCLKCFQKWVGQGKNTCAKCRAPIPSKMVSLPRINSALVMAIRMAKAAKLATSGRSTQVYYFLHNQDRPDKAFTTERAKKAGKANACSGQIFVTIPSDHFGPITAEHDPKRNQGILVGETWEDRMECRQWGVHFPHVSGIAGQSEYGAQSVALSGGYEDDEDHGDWFLYTGSGGRDLSGNKRTNKEHAFDQKFEKYNEALRVSCRKGYPVRVVRSHKEKRSSYAPETGVRYDGIYRIEKCWRKVGSQGFKMCRYLFVRCDNEPAPWTSDEHGDRPRPLSVIKELKVATDITERKESPAWDYDEKVGWKWMKPPPPSKKPVIQRDPKDGMMIRKVIRKARNSSVKGKLLKELGCLICRKVMKFPLTTPCAHNFCKSCLLDSYGSISFVKERTWENGRTLRAQKIVNKCPCCPTDISEFLQNPQVNRDMMNLIESLQREQDRENTDESCEEDHEKVNVGESDEANAIIVKSSKEANDPDENKTTSPRKGNEAEEKKSVKKPKAKKLDCKSGEEECNETNSNGERYDEVEDSRLNTEDGQTKLMEGGGSLGLDPSTRLSHVSLSKKQTSETKRSAKKTNKCHKSAPKDDNNLNTGIVNKMSKSEDGDSESNAGNSEQSKRSVDKAPSPNANCNPEYPFKRKKTGHLYLHSGVRTRSMGAK